MAPERGRDLAARRLAELKRLIDEAADREDGEADLLHVREAQGLSDQVEELLMDEGFFLTLLGRLDEAAACYEDLAARANRVDALVCAAQARLERREISRGRALALQAIEQDPTIVLGMIGHEVFAPIVHEPEFDQVLRSLSVRR